MTATVDARVGGRGPDWPWFLLFVALYAAFLWLFAGSLFGCSFVPRVQAGAELAERRVARAADEVGALASDVAALASAARGPAREATALLADARVDYEAGKLGRAVDRVLWVVGPLGALVAFVVAFHAVAHAVILSRTAAAEREDDR